MLGLKSYTIPVAALVSLALGAPAQAQTKLRIASTLPDSNFVVTDILKPWAEYVNAHGKGKIEIRLLNGPTIANHTNIYDRILDGVVDGGWVAPGNTGKPFPRTLVIGLPFLSESSAQATAGLKALLDAGMLDSEFKGVHVVALSSMPAFGLHTTGPVERVSDVAGLKLRAADKVAAQTISEMGASPISIPITEAYQALAQGVANGIVTGWPGLIIFKLNEVVHHHLDVPLGQSPLSVLISGKVWDALSKEQQDLLGKSTGGMPLRDAIAKFGDSSNGRFRQMIIDQGNKVHKLTPEQFDQWKNATSKVRSEWVSERSEGDKVIEIYTKAAEGVK